MGIFDRIILMLYTLSLTVLSALFVAVAAGWSFPLDYIRTTLENPNGRWALGITSAAFLVVSLRFIWYVFSPRGERGGRRVYHETELGVISISLDAVENLVKKSARQVRGVRDVKAKVENSGGGVQVFLKTVVTPETSVPEASKEIERILRHSVKSVIGVELTGLNVSVENIAADGGRRGRFE